MGLGQQVLAGLALCVPEEQMAHTNSGMKKVFAKDPRCALSEIDITITWYIARVVRKHNFSQAVWRLWDNGADGACRARAMRTSRKDRHAVDAEVEGLQLDLQGEGLGAGLAHQLHCSEAHIAVEGAVAGAVAGRGRVGNCKGVQRLAAIAHGPPQLKGVGVHQDLQGVGSFLQMLQSPERQAQKRVTGNSRTSSSNFRINSVVEVSGGFCQCWLVSTFTQRGISTLEQRNADAGGQDSPVAMLACQLFCSSALP